MRVSVDKQDGEETGLRRGGKALEHMSQHRQSCSDPDRLITDSAHDLAKTQVHLAQPVLAVDVRTPTAPKPDPNNHRFCIPSSIDLCESRKV